MLRKNKLKLHYIAEIKLKKAEMTELKKYAKAYVRAYNLGIELSYCQFLDAKKVDSRKLKTCMLEHGIDEDMCSDVLPELQLVLKKHKFKLVIGLTSFSKTSVFKRSIKHVLPEIRSENNPYFSVSPLDVEYIKYAKHYVAKSYCFSLPLTVTQMREIYKADDLGLVQVCFEPPVDANMVQLKFFSF